MSDYSDDTTERNPDESQDPRLEQIIRLMKNHVGYELRTRYTIAVEWKLQGLTNIEVAELLEIEPEEIPKMCAPYSTNKYFNLNNKDVVNPYLDKYNCEPNYLNKLSKKKFLSRAEKDTFNKGMEKLGQIALYINPKFLTDEEIDEEVDYPVS